MTLAVAVVTTEGVVLCADSQVTYGETRWQIEKIKQLNDGCIWAGAGDLSLLQRLTESLPPTSVVGPLISLRDQLAVIAKQCAQATLNLDLRTGYPLKDPIENLHAYDLLFVEFRDGVPRLLHISPYGPEWVDGFHAVGSGQPFAFAILQRFRGANVSLDDGALLAYRVVSEAIQVASFGLGGPVALWAVTRSGVHKYSPAEMKALDDAYGVLLVAELELLTRAPRGGTTSPSAPAPSP